MAWKEDGKAVLLVAVGVVVASLFMVPMASALWSKVSGSASSGGQ